MLGRRHALVRLGSSSRDERRCTPTGEGGHAWVWPLHSRGVEYGKWPSDREGGYTLMGIEAAGCVWQGRTGQTCAPCRLRDGLHALCVARLAAADFAWHQRRSPGRGLWARNAISETKLHLTIAISTTAIPLRFWGHFWVPEVTLIPYGHLCEWMVACSGSPRQPAAGYQF